MKFGLLVTFSVLLIYTVFNGIGNTYEFFRLQPVSFMLIVFGLFTASMVAEKLIISKI